MAGCCLCDGADCPFGDVGDEVFICLGFQQNAGKDLGAEILQGVLRDTGPRKHFVHKGQRVATVVAAEILDLLLHKGNDLLREWHRVAMVLIQNAQVVQSIVLLAPFFIVCLRHLQCARAETSNCLTGLTQIVVS